MGDIITYTIDTLGVSHEEVQYSIDEDVALKASEGYILKKMQKFDEANTIVLYYKKEEL